MVTPAKAWTTSFCLLLVGLSRGCPAQTPIYYVETTLSTRGLCLTARHRQGWGGREVQEPTPGDALCILNLPFFVCKGDVVRWGDL